MRIKTDFFKDFLTNFDLTSDVLAEKLTVIGHESEVINDQEVDVSIFPNRGDCLSMRGLSRELAAFYPEVGKTKEVEIAPLPKPADFYNLKVSNQATDFVERDFLLKIENYQSTASPAVLLERLKYLGLQPRDLVIDLTNLISYGLGMPLHVFDYDKVADGLTIDFSHKGEKIKLLNGKDYSLDNGALIQRAGDNLADLAGTMGGLNSAVSQMTKTVLVQAAIFNSKAVRQNSKQTGIVTEASYRFVRGVDPELCELALGRLLKIVTELIPGSKATAYQEYEKGSGSVKIEVQPEQVSRLLGIDISTKNLETLSQLGFEYDGTAIKVPTWRQDVQIVADVAEEVGRVIGLDNIQPRELSKKTVKRVGEYYEILGTKQVLSDLGFNEASNISLVESAGEIKLSNPRTKEQQELRSNLLGGLLDTLARNPFLRRTMFFEIGDVFEPEEKTMLGLITAGYKEGSIKSVAELLGKKLGLPVEFEMVDQRDIDRHEVKQSKIWFCQLPVSRIKTSIENFPTIELPKYQPISKYPPLVRDITLINESRSLSEITDDFAKQFDNLLLVELVDEYHNSENGEKSLTFRLIFENINQSFNEEEISAIDSKLYGNS